MKKILAALLIIAAAGTGASSAAVVLVENGEPRAVIVTADEPAMVAVYAARELAGHVKIATGAELPIAPESRIPEGYTSRVFIGETAAAREQGIRPEEMGHDEFILRTAGADLYVLGMEDRSRGRLMEGPEEERVLTGGFSGIRPVTGKTSPNGTLFGVYELLGRYPGVRWLWPGEHGTYIPKTATIEIESPLDEEHFPKLGHRNYSRRRVALAADLAAKGECEKPHGRIWRLTRHVPPELVSEIEGLTFSARALIDYNRDLTVFLARHRLGNSVEKPESRHVFHGWWRRYGEEHPEWFMKREDGGRGPLPGRTVAAMCVSNPDLHRHIVEEFWDGGDYLPLGEVDSRIFCSCEECLAWDGPQPEDYPSFAGRDYNPRMVSDRYARFWKTIQEMAAGKNPDVTVTSFLYINYFPSPLSDIELNDRIFGEFCPWTGPTPYYPRREEVDSWVRKQWLGWAERGIRMAYRPNNFWGGYVMPHLSTRQAGDFFRFAYENGMEGFFFDSLFGQWAAQGPMFYMYMRMAWFPDKDIEDIRREYFEAFGPAEKHIEQYFDYWEEHSSVRGGGSLINPVTAAAAFPPEKIEQGMAILKEAYAAAREHPLDEYAERVGFLMLGLEHARLSAEFMGATDGGRIPSHDAEPFLKAQRAFMNLVNFRREHEHLYIADIKHAARQEARYMDLPALLKNVEEAVEDSSREFLSDPWSGWSFAMDPENRGMAEKWYALDYDRSGWKPIEVPSFLSATWAGEYLGHGWYRTEFTVPEDRTGEDLKLLFESVDEEAWVFVNGQYAGEHTEASEQRPTAELWNEPFTISVDGGKLIPGKKNVLVVRIRAEAGQAGIWLPVRAYFQRAPWFRGI